MSNKPCDNSMKDKLMLFVCDNNIKAATIK